MPKINARKCPRTGKLFETDEAYRKHIVGLRKRLNETRPAKIAARKAAQRRKDLRADVRAELDAIQDIENLEKYIKENFNRVMIAWNGGSNPAVHELLDQIKMEEFDLRLRFSEKVSNTHNRPRDGVTNWGGRTEGAPRGYPGWSGHVSFTLNMDPSSHEHEFTRTLTSGILCLEPERALGWAGIHTGTGGGRGGPSVHKWEYGCEIFLNDFEGLKKLYFHDKLADKLDLW